MVSADNQPWGRQPAIHQACHRGLVVEQSGYAAHHLVIPLNALSSGQSLRKDVVTTVDVTASVQDHTHQQILRGPPICQSMGSAESAHVQLSSIADGLLILQLIMAL